MYSIEKHNDYLLVKFEGDFDYSTIKVIIHHETQLPEYGRMNDIWLIGKHRSLISMSEMDSIIDDFICRCPPDASREKTAIVVEAGLTEAIVDIGIKEIENRVPFEFRIFHTLEEAEKWLGVDEQEAA